MSKKIKSLIKQIKDRTALIDEIEEVTEAKRFNIVSNWFSPYKGYPVPKKHEETVISLIEKRLALQN